MLTYPHTMHDNQGILNIVDPKFMQYLILIIQRLDLHCSSPSACALHLVIFPPLHRAEAEYPWLEVSENSPYFIQSSAVQVKFKKNAPIA